MHPDVVYKRVAGKYVNLFICSACLFTTGVVAVASNVMGHNKCKIIEGSDMVQKLIPEGILYLPYSPNIIGNSNPLNKPIKQSRNANSIWRGAWNEEIPFNDRIILQEEATLLFHISIFTLMSEIITLSTEKDNNNKPYVLIMKAVSLLRKAYTVHLFTCLLTTYWDLLQYIMIHI